MKQYNSFDDALADIVQSKGIEIIRHSNRLVALIADYIPNLGRLNYSIRPFIRADNFVFMLEEMRKGTDYVLLLGHMCEKIVQSIEDDDARWETFKAIKRLSGMYSKNYLVPIESSLLFNKGVEYYRQVPKEINVQTAMLLFREAINLGNDNALVYMANSYLKGKGVTQDTDKGMHYLQLAAEKGNIQASLKYAEYLWKGINTEQDIAKAISVLEKVNHSNAYFMLGEIYHENNSDDKAVCCYLKAALQDNVYAQYMLALDYALGRGTSRNMDEAKKWLRSAAKMGHSEARKKMEELGEKWN